MRPCTSQVGVGYLGRFFRHVRVRKRAEPLPVSGAPGVDERHAGAALRRVVPPVQALVARPLVNRLQKITLLQLHN